MVEALSVPPPYPLYQSRPQPPSSWSTRDRENFISFFPVRQLRTTLSELEKIKDETPASEEGKPAAVEDPPVKEAESAPEAEAPEAPEAPEVKEDAPVEGRPEAEENEPMIAKDSLGKGMEVIEEGEEEAGLDEDKNKSK